MELALAVAHSNLVVVPCVAEAAAEQDSAQQSLLADLDSVQISKIDYDLMKN